MIEFFFDCTPIEAYDGIWGRATDRTVIDVDYEDVSDQPPKTAADLTEGGGDSADRP